MAKQESNIDYGWEHLHPSDNLYGNIGDPILDDDFMIGEGIIVILGGVALRVIGQRIRSKSISALGELTTILGGIELVHGISKIPIVRHFLSDKLNNLLNSVQTSSAPETESTRLIQYINEGKK